MAATGIRNCDHPQNSCDYDHAAIFPQKCSPPRATIIPRKFAAAVILLAMKFPVTKALILQVQEVDLRHNQARHTCETLACTVTAMKESNS